MPTLQDVKLGFESVKVADHFKQAALSHIDSWLTKPEFAEYLPQLSYLIEAGHWDYLLDCFYQVIPFGTGGRRGEVGIGPNRINLWTIRSSAQGHAQFLVKQYGEDAKSRGVVLAYDVREFFTNQFFSDSLPNPVRNLTCKDLAHAAAEVYAANGIKVHLFSEHRTTPELSFAIRHLGSVAGDMFSASHNPPEHNGKKVYDEFGGQLIPPHDEALVVEVTQHVSEIRSLPFDEAVKSGLVQFIDESVDVAYWETVQALSKSKERNISIVYTPLHGCGGTSILPILQRLGFAVHVDPKTSNPSGKFENVMFNIPNPEVEQSFLTAIEHANSVKADIILNSDPDADRIGIMAKHNNEWVFFNGNEIGVLLAKYIVSKTPPEKLQESMFIKTDVTTNLITAIAEKHGMSCIGNLLVGFKYIGEEMNRLEKAGKIDSMLLGCEESHGFIAGNYVRDKDAAVASVWLAELAAEQKKLGKTLVQYLDEIYQEYGYFMNYLTEIRLPGAEGMSQIAALQSALRSSFPEKVGRFEFDKLEDWGDRTPIVSETDRVSKNGLVFHFKAMDKAARMKVTVRPSGTEPKIKMYFEIGSVPFEASEVQQIKSETAKLKDELEKAFMLHCYSAMGVEFPERGFLLFWQLPLSSKLKYFEIEPEIEALISLPVQERESKLASLLQFLGSNPVEKIDKAFREKHKKGVREFLEI